MHAVDPQIHWRTTHVSGWGGDHDQASARRAAWLVILIVDAGFLLWGAMAALVPEHLLGPGSKPILTAGYEGFTNGSWSELAQTSPKTAVSSFAGVTYLFALVAVQVGRAAAGYLVIVSCGDDISPRQPQEIARRCSERALISRFRSVPVAATRCPT